MKVIFLDIDGVLNNLETKDRITPMLMGIEDSKVELLLKIVSETNSEIVLISTWGIHWKAEEEIFVSQRKWGGNDDNLILQEETSNGWHLRSLYALLK